MTDRIYYTDPYARDFDARVVTVDRLDGKPVAILDRTAFYPTSGGQPFDTGTLNDTPVLDVIDRDDGEILHVVEGELAAGTSVRGRIAWDRRFEHMQQHTGQHVLSAAFDRLSGVRTVSFHLGTTASTIDLARQVTPAEIEGATREANKVVWEDRPVGIRFASADEAAAMPLRKEPKRTGPLRLIDVEGFDLSACGGTHVARTGSIGIIAVSGTEKFKGGTRVEFVCGGRALRAFGELRTTVDQSLRLLSVLPTELPPAIERLQTDAREVRKVVRGLQERLAVYEAEDLAARAPTVEGVAAIVEAVSGYDVAGLKTMASTLVTKPARVAVLLSDAAPFAIVVARSADVSLDAAAVLRELTARFGGKGGGKPDLAQGGGLTGAKEEILEHARSLVGVLNP